MLARRVSEPVAVTSRPSLALDNEDIRRRHVYTRVRMSAARYSPVRADVSTASA